MSKLLILHKYKYIILSLILVLLFFALVTQFFSSKEGFYTNNDKPEDVLYGNITYNPEIFNKSNSNINTKLVNEHSHNKKDYGHFIPKIQHSYIDWGQFATKSEVIKKYSINKHEAAADGTLVENMKNELVPYFIDKCLFVHN